MVKAWRSLTQEQRMPYLQQARDNRMTLKLKKAQEQDKLQQAKSLKEAEQERQWKQMQAMRQQQAQQQQQMMQDQRVQATQRVRQLTADQVAALPSEAQSPVNSQQGPRMVGPLGTCGPHSSTRGLEP